MSAPGWTPASDQPSPTAQADEAPRPCWGCGHVHADGPGRCWEAACAPECTALPTCPQPYRPDAL